MFPFSDPDLHIADAAFRAQLTARSFSVAKESEHSDERAQARRMVALHAPQLKKAGVTDKSGRFGKITVYIRTYTSHSIQHNVCASVAKEREHSDERGQARRMVALHAPQLESWGY